MKTKLFTLLLAVAAGIGTMFAEVVEINDVHYYLDATNQTAKIVASENSVLDFNWNTLPAEYVASATRPDNRFYTGLNNVKVYADEQYINILLEPNVEELEDSSYILSMYLWPTYPSNRGGYSGWLFADPSDWLLESEVHLDGQMHTFSPYIAQWGGQDVVSEEWLWKTVATEGTIPLGTCRYVDNKFEIRIERGLIPVRWASNNNFSIGFVLSDLSWQPVGVLPQYDSANKLQVQVYDPYLSTTNIVSGDLVIPSSVTHNGITYSVTRIGNYAFRGRSGLTSVTIPNSVTSIGKWAFSGCSGLMSIELPNSVKSIGFEAFMDCGNLTSVILPDSVMIIEQGAFWGCYNMTSVTIPTGVISLGISSFGLTHLDSVVWNAKRCSDFEPGFNKPWGTTTPPYLSFTFGNDVESIPEYLCANMVNLTSITLPDGITHIGAHAFDGCTGLTSIKIPNSVENSVCRISDLQAMQIAQVEAPAWFFDVQESDWPSCPKYLQTLTVNGAELNDNVYGVIQRSNKTLQALNVSNITNTSLADEAFKGFYNLRTLTLPSNLERIGYMAVAGCKNLQSIDIPAPVEEIEQSAFEDCRSLKSITFGGSSAGAPGRFNAPATSASQLRRIGNWAFYNAHELQNLEIPEGVEEIGDGAFYGCTYLEDLVLPSSVQTIGDNTFALCAKLQKIVVNSVTPPTIEAKTFFDVKRQIPVYVPDEAVASYDGDIYWREFDIQGASQMPTGIDNVSSSLQGGDGGRLILRNGQIFILRGDKTFTVTGQEVK